MTHITITNPVYPELDALKVHMRPDGVLSIIECATTLGNITRGEVDAAAALFGQAGEWHRITAWEFSKD